MAIEVAVLLLGGQLGASSRTLGLKLNLRRGVFTACDLQKMGAIHSVPLLWKELARVMDLGSGWSGCAWC
eukprot:1151887-Pelagomonas_calceolata.AAC.1